jgi:hypothetical protein
VDNSAAVFASMARSVAIFGMSGSTARVKIVDANTTRLTIFRVAGMGGPLQIFCKLVARMERFRAFTPVFAGYA